MLNAKANIKRSHNIWFHLYNVLEINDRDGKRIIGFQELGIVGEGGGECDYKGEVWGRSIQASAWVFGQCWFYRRCELHYEVGPTLGLTFSTSIVQWVAAGCVDRGGIRGKLTSWMGNSHFNKGNSPEKVVALIG